MERADVRGRIERPHGFAVEALQGAFTLWNQQPDPAVEIIQVSKPLGSTLELRGDLTSSGGEGQSLVQGVQTTLKAIALSVKPGGTIARLASKGPIAASGDDEGANGQHHRT